jgi:outer membrane protein OmpA-like peptidoglycan-associated protein
LSNSTLSGTNLTNADLSRANLTNATVDHAIAVHTRFDGAILVNVDMSLLIQKPPARPAFTDARTISSALKIDPAQPSMPRKIDLTVNFDFNSDQLNAEGAKQVREIASALMDEGLKKSHITIEGHTDSIGSDAYNQDLSYRRAKRVLIGLTTEYNISPARLSAKGFGKTRPIASNDNDLGRAMNRRVTLVNPGN